MLAEPPKEEDMEACLGCGCVLLLVLCVWWVMLVSLLLLGWR